MAEHKHDPQYSRFVCGACGNQESWCATCRATLCGCQVEPAPQEPCEIAFSDVEPGMVIEVRERESVVRDRVNVVTEHYIDGHTMINLWDVRDEPERYGCTLWLIEDDDDA